MTTVTNPHADTLETLLTLYLSVETEEDLAQARHQAQALLQAAPQQHARRGNAWSYAAPRVPAGATIQDRYRGGQWVAAQALAEFYVNTFNDLRAAGSPPDLEAIEAVQAELEPYGFGIEETSPGRYRWVSLWEDDDADDVADALPHARRGLRLAYAAQRAPKGGISLGGTFYPGGRFIPGAKIAQATPEEKARLDSAQEADRHKNQARAEQRRSRGAVQVQALQGRLDAKRAGYLTRQQQIEAKRSLHGILRHHGGLALHRIEELASQVEAALDRLPPLPRQAKAAEREARDLLARRLKRRLEQIHWMLNEAQSRGVSGTGEDWTPPPKVPKAKFTGTDRLGRKWVEGKLARKGTGDGLEATGAAGAAGGLSAGQPVGTAVVPPFEGELPGSGAGTPPGGRPESVPGSADGSGDADRRAVGGAGDAASGGAGAGAGSALPDAGGTPGAVGGTGSPDGDDGRRRSVLVESALAGPPTPEAPTDLAAGNWRYAGKDFVPRGDKAKYRANIEALRVLKNLRLEGRTTPTPAEQATLSKYIGWGQFPQLFDYKYHPDWQRERDELRSLLSEEEWTSARESILNAHYTHPDVVEAHWQMARRLGFTGGRFLETSAGIGYYLGLMPEDLASRTHASAVEKDTVSGKILKLLYPAANVQVQPFEEFRPPDNFYDLVASNVPFGDYRVHDPQYNKHRAKIHDYFFLKSLDKVRPGGLVMHVTSAGTLDKADSKIREELAKQGELVAAIRFPGGTHQENAGTAVVTDLIILRKKHPNEPPVDPDHTPEEAQPKEPGFTGITVDALGRTYHWVDGKRVPGPNWLETTTVPDPDGGEPIRVNRYFADHPEQVLGRLDRTGSMYRGESMNVTKTDDYAQRLQAAMARLPEGLLKQATAPPERFAPEAMPAPGETKEGGYVVQAGKVFVKDQGRLVEQKMDGKSQQRLLGHLAIRDAVRDVLNTQLRGEDATAARERLNQVYDTFVTEHGPLNSVANKRVFRADPDAPVLLSLEHYHAASQQATKADIFHKDTIRPYKAKERAETVEEALTATLQHAGRLDIDHMAKLLGATPEAVGRHLIGQKLAFRDPSEGWQMASLYLSGNVRRKLLLARAAAQADPSFAPNVTALEAVQPEDIEVDQIGVRLGAPWVPPADVAQFVAELIGARPEAFDVKYVAGSDQWFVDFGKGISKWQKNHLDRAGERWGTDRVDFLDVLEAACNDTPITVWDKLEDGTRVVNRAATDDANAKVTEVKEAFKGWIWEDEARRQRLHRFYNDNFNNIVTTRYDGSHQEFPGMNPAIQLRDHQKNFVWQVVTTGKGLAGHEVGTGKTYSMVAAAMELRRLGLAKKPAIACLKANVERVTQEAFELYPGAKIISTVDMFDAKSRKETISRIATGDYDMVILTHDQLDLLQMKPEVAAKFIREELSEVEAAIEAAIEENDGKDSPTSKALEKTRKRLAVRLLEALDETKKDDAVYFEETGIDTLFVDEAHKYKSLPVYTRQRGLKGIPTSASQRATNMQMRARWLMEQNSGRGVIFATGTPVANTMAELYNMQKYLQPQELKERGIYSFDAWAKTFGNVRTKNEFTVTGEYKPVARFAEFVNLPELTNMVGQVLDVQRADDLRDANGEPVIKRPTRKDEVIVAPSTVEMARLMSSLQERAKRLKGNAEKGQDNMLAICSDGRKGAIDLRLLDPGAPDDPNSKVNQAVAKVLQLHRAHPDKTQMIFSDIGVRDLAKAKAKKSTEEDDGGHDRVEDLLGGASGFHLYGDIINKLVAGGIPREKIADFSQLEGAKKEAAMEGLRRGEILVALGSTEKLGTGVNAQHKVMALHHLDVPWLPASVEQRDGRGWRQHNENKEVGIYRYVTEKSLDQTFWQVIGNKASFIKQVLGSKKAGMRVARDDDGEELSPEQLMAAASGDARIMEKVDLEMEVKQLQSAESRHLREQQKLKDKVAATERNVPHLERAAARLRQDAERLAAQPEFSFAVGGKSFDKRPEAEAAFREWREKNAELIRSPYGKNRIGQYRGFTVAVKNNQFLLESPDGNEYETGDSLASIEYVARNLAKKAELADLDAQMAKTDLERTKASLGKPFAKAEELKAKQARVKELEIALGGKVDAKQATMAGQADLPPEPPAPAPRPESPGSSASPSRPRPEPAHPPVSPARKEAIHQALRQLAGMDADGARERNNVGFNQMDSSFGRSLAQRSELTDAQAQAAARMLAKYRRQLGEELTRTITTPDAPTPTPPPPATPKPVNSKHVAQSVQQLYRDLESQDVETDRIEAVLNQLNSLTRDGLVEVAISLGFPLSVGRLQKKALQESIRERVRGRRHVRERIMQSRPAQAIQYRRLALHALQTGDRASARIYARQAARSR